MQKLSMRFSCEFATKLLENEDFCTAHYRDYLNEAMRNNCFFVAYISSQFN